VRESARLHFALLSRNFSIASILPMNFGPAWQPQCPVGLIQAKDFDQNDIRMPRIRRCRRNANFDGDHPRLPATCALCPAAAATTWLATERSLPGASRRAAAPPPHCPHSGSLPKHPPQRRGETSSNRLGPEVAERRAACTCPEERPLGIKASTTLLPGMRMTPSGGSYGSSSSGGDVFSTAMRPPPAPRVPMD
jgi:hypothetical protein